MEVAFPDGDRIHQDVWREDMLIYYVPKSDWRRAVGMQVVPDYSPRAAHPVTIRFWEGSLKQLKSLSDPHLALMLHRCAQAFASGKFYGWRTLTFELPDWLVARVGESDILQAFEGAGWHFQTKDSNRYKWKRDSPDGAA